MLSRLTKTMDVTFSIILVFIAPAIAGFGLVRFAEGDFLGKAAALGLLVIALFVFGIACMGSSRLSIFFQRKSV